MSEIVIIFPSDETTDFLEPIPSYLRKKFPTIDFKEFRIGYNLKEHEDCRLFLKNECKDDSLIIFLGHGRSDALLGSWSNSFSRVNLLEKDDIILLKNKRIFALACKSRELIAGHGIHGIGFGNIPTSMSEITEARNGNANRYYGVESKDIENFNAILISVVKLSLSEFISNNLNLDELYLLVKLRLNKKLASLITENEPSEVESLVNLIYEAKNEMQYFYMP